MPQDKQPNYYQLLGVSKSATCNDVQKAYREQAKVTHPDLFLKEEKEEKTKIFHQVIQAKEVLCDPEQRKIYDLNSSRTCIWPHGTTEEVKILYDMYYNLKVFDPNFNSSKTEDSKYCAYNGGLLTVFLSVLSSLNNKYVPILPVFSIINDLRQDAYEYVKINGILERDELTDLENNCLVAGLFPAIVSFMSASVGFAKHPSISKLASVFISPLVAATIPCGISLTRTVITKYTNYSEANLNLINIIAGFITFGMVSELVKHPLVLSLAFLPRAAAEHLSSEVNEQTDYQLPGEILENNDCAI